MKKLNKIDMGYQEIEIIEYEIINDFISTFLPFWKEDIIDFDKYKGEINVNNVDKLIIGCYISLDEDLDYYFVYNNGKRKNYYIPADKFMAWLEKHDLVEEIK